jgi:hypothetical protein
MAEVDRIYESKVKFSGLFDFKSLYNFIFTWLSDYGYGIIEEKSYTEKIKPEGKEIEISWNARRKISDYFRFLLKIGWRILGMTNVEVQKGGIKTKLNKGDVEIKITGFLEKDYEHRWETSPFFKFLRTIYDKYIIKSRIEGYERKIMEEVDELVAQTKSYLEMEGKRL